jgi:predicted nucleic acid-binding protein
VILLDTDVLSALRRPEGHPRVAAWIAGQDEGALFVSAVTIGEIARGVALEARCNPAAGLALADWLDRTCLQFADRILPFDAQAARLWGRLSAEIGHGGADLQIAATALAAGFTVATRNTRHFAPTGVALVDPSVG